MPDLERLPVDQQSVMVGGRAAGRIWLAENNRSDPTTGAIRSVGDLTLPDRANGFGEVILELKTCPRTQRLVFLGGWIVLLFALHPADR